MEKWVVLRKGGDFKALGARFGVDPLLARLIRNREITSPEEMDIYLNGRTDDLHSPMLFKDMDKAVSIIKACIDGKKQIRIIGDYDIDGIMSTYILLTGLKRLNAAVDIQIPDRITDGYGLNESLVIEAKDAGTELILTCDNGISAYDQIQKAKELGMMVVVTDHHEVPFKEEDGNKTYIIPPADAVVNPKQEDCPYPYKGLCGAAVAYKLLEALYEIYEIPKKEIHAFLEYAGFATVGDVMDLTGENRIIVKEALKLLNHTSNIGMKELIRQCDLVGKKITAYHIGFVLGPCLNASGRLDTAKRAIELLDSKTKEEAASLAGDLKALNESRKAMTQSGVEEAEKQIEDENLVDDKVLVIYLPDCHESLAGIIAGRIREVYYKPVFVLTKGAEGVKGSGRSIDSYNMYEELCKVEDLLPKFGGHKLAAGLSLAEEDVLTFRKAINEKANLTEEDMTEKIVIDAVLPFSYITMRLIEQLNVLEPFGKANTKPVFAEQKLTLSNFRIMGKNQNVAKVRLTDEGGYSIDGIYFGDTKEFHDYAAKHRRLMITYYPQINSYMGRDSIQVVIQKYR